MEKMAEGRVAEGWRGVIYRKVRNGIVYAEKRAKTPAVYGALAKEAILLEKLTKAKVRCVPAYIGSGEGWLESEWRDGDGFDKVWQETAEKGRHLLIKGLIDAAYELDKNGIIHGELHRPMSNVRVRHLSSNATTTKEEKDTRKTRDTKDTKEPQDVPKNTEETDDGYEYEYEITILDFERGTMGDDSGRNMRAIAQWMLTEKLLQVDDLKRLGTMTKDEIYVFLSSLHTPDIFMNQKTTTNQTTNRQTTTNQTTNRQTTTSTRTGSTAFSHIMSTPYVLIGVIIAGAMLDILTKYMLFDLRIGEELRWLTPVFNPGSGWSMPIPRIVSAILAAIAMLGILRLYRHKHIPRRAAMCIGAGALGNMYDRVVYHGVRDMFDLQVWPVFNVADIMLTIGVIVYVRRIFFNKPVSTHE